MGLELAILIPIKAIVMKNITIASFVIMFVLVCVIFNVIFLAFFGRTKEFRYITDIVRSKTGKRK
jgi:hypothetical protein